MKKLLIIALFLVVFLGFAEKSLAVDVESGFLFGTMRFDGGRPENSGRKFSIGFVTDLIWRGELEKTLGLRFQTIAEPTDCTIKILNDLFAFFGKLQFELNPNDKTVFSPFLGVEIQQWKRNSSGELWGDLLFIQALFGLGLKHDDLYFQLGGILPPFWTHVDEGPAPDGELGFMISGQILCKNKIELGVDSNY